MVGKRRLGGTRSALRRPRGLTPKPREREVSGCLWCPRRPPARRTLPGKRASTTGYPHRGPLRPAIGRATAAPLTSGEPARAGLCRSDCISAPLNPRNGWFRRWPATDTSPMELPCGHRPDLLESSPTAGHEPVRHATVNLSGQDESVQSGLAPLCPRTVSRHLAGPTIRARGRNVKAPPCRHLRPVAGTRPPCPSWYAGARPLRSCRPPADRRARGQRSRRSPTHAHPQSAWRH